MKDEKRLTIKDLSAQIDALQKQLTTTQRFETQYVLQLSFTDIDCEIKLIKTLNPFYYDLNTQKFKFHEYNGRHRRDSVYGFNYIMHPEYDGYDSDKILYFRRPRIDSYFGQSDTCDSLNITESLFHNSGIHCTIILTPAQYHELKYKLQNTILETQDPLFIVEYITQLIQQNKSQCYLKPNDLQNFATCYATYLTVYTKLTTNLKLMKQQAIKKEDE